MGLLIEKLNSKRGRAFLILWRQNDILCLTE